MSGVRGVRLSHLYAWRGLGGGDPNWYIIRNNTTLNSFCILSLLARMTVAISLAPATKPAADNSFCNHDKSGRGLTDHAQKDEHEPAPSKWEQLLHCPGRDYY